MAEDRRFLNGKLTIPIEIIGNLCIIENVDEAFNFRTTERRILKNETDDLFR